MNLIFNYFNKIGNYLGPKIVYCDIDNRVKIT